MSGDAALAATHVLWFPPRDICDSIRLRKSGQSVLAEGLFQVHGVEVRQSVKRWVFKGLTAVCIGCWESSGLGEVQKCIKSECVHVSMLNLPLGNSS